ncbi:UNVERIFIED_CONTAM: hypothetical protein Sindi_2619200, partial [Sesamum indicum]
FSTHPTIKNPHSQELIPRRNPETSIRMGKPVTTFLLLSTLLALAVALVNGDAAAAATPSTICNVSVSELVKCLPAITGKSPPWPTKSCCSVISKANLHCLCNYKSEISKFGVDPAKALALPKKCGLKAPRECTKKYLR